jgi:hypothetical protein
MLGWTGGAIIWIALLVLVGRMKSSHGFPDRRYCCLLFFTSAIKREVVDDLGESIGARYGEKRVIKKSSLVKP